MRHQDLTKLNNILKSLEGYELFHYNIKDVRYPNSPDEYLRLEIVLEKEVVEIEPAEITDLIEESNLPKRYVSNKSMSSIGQYMLILGIDRKDIYSKATLQPGYSRDELDKIERGYGKDTIYKRFELYELEAMIESAHLKKAHQIHPDLHTQDKDYYNDEMAKLNNARDKALNILRWRGL